MSAREVGIAGLVRQDPELDHLVELIRSVGAPGDFHASGRDFVPMPRVSVAGIGSLSFPVPEEQIRALVAEAESAPYGRGVETVVDPEVRNSFQIAPGRVRISSPRWEAVFGEVLAGTTKALGCAEGSLSAELYKLLVYEPGGFFLPHRDTEKAPGMVATLVIALPTAGAGGELVVRHLGREVVVPMQTDHPSELIHAAFYADCEHEIRPVTSGARVALVYNLIRRSEGALEEPLDREALVAALASELRAQFARPDGPRKLIWVLEHEYSEAGLSFDTLKNVDAGVGGALLKAAVGACCSIHAALLEGSQTDHVIPYTDGDEIEDPFESDYEVTDTEGWGFEVGGLRRPGARSGASGNLAAALGGPDAMAGPLRTLIRARAADVGPAMIGLMDALARGLGDVEPTKAWTDVLEALAQDFLRTLTRETTDPEPRASGTGPRRRLPLRSGDLATLCGLGSRLDLDSEVADSIERLFRERRVYPPAERTGAAAAIGLWEESSGRCGGAAFRSLWEWVTRFLLSRSSAPPGPPADRVVPSRGVGCSFCALCRELRAFCAHPEAREHRFVRVQADRRHVERQIRGNTDFRFRTLKEGLPHTLIVTKTRARHERRLREYAEDVRNLRRLLRAAKAVAGAKALSSEITAAIERADPAASR